MLLQPLPGPDIDLTREERAGSLGVVLLLGEPLDHGVIASELEQAGFEVRRESSLGCMHGPAADAVVIYLDGALCDGLAWCTAWRSSNVPAIALTGHMGEDVVFDAYGAGADYVAAIDTAPSVLTAHLRALLRRAPRARVDAPPEHLPIVDVTTRCTTIAGEKVPLADDELEVLRLLLARPGLVVRRQQIKDILAYDASRRHQDRVVDSCIRRLRDKLEEVDRVRHIVAVRGVGFRYQVTPRKETVG